MLGPALIVCIFWLGLFEPSISIAQYFAAPPPAVFVYQGVDEVESPPPPPTTTTPTKKSTTTTITPSTSTTLTTTTTAPPPPPAVTSGVEQWRELVASIWPADQVDRALCVIDHESKGGDPNAENPTSSAVGLFQIMYSVWGPEYGYSYESLKDPTINVQVALWVWEKQGWGAWAAVNRGIC